jgi:microcystin-dependent protein
MAFLNIAPTGTVLPFAGSIAPEGWLLCNGASQSTTTYANLFAVIGYTYGGTGGSFSLPDMQGVFPRGAGTNLTANYGGLAGHTPAGGALASKGRQRTGPNGLSNGGSNTVTGTAAGQSFSGNANVKTGASGQDYYSSGNNIAPTNYVADSYAGSYVGLVASNAGYPIYTPLNHTHGTSALTATSAAPVISSTDNETTPAFLALNYIIKA